MWSPTVTSDELYHHGILGMKWGVRRYQNPDGTLTAKGRKHLGIQQSAADYAKKQARRATLNAEDYEKDIAANKKRYTGEKGYENWKKDTGEEGRDKYEYDLMYMQIDEIVARDYRKEAQKWMSKADKFMNTPVSELSKADFKEAKKYAKMNKK